MYPDGLIEIGGKSYVTLYGICIAIGIILCIMTLHFLGNKLKVNKQFLSLVETIAYCAILVGFFSAAVFQGIYTYIETGIFSLNSGITFLGGLIGGVVSFIAIYLVLRKKATGRITDILPIAPCCILIAHSLGRLGCFFAGCCGGIRTDSWLGIKFPGTFVKVYPTQLFEAIFLLVFFIVLSLLVYKKNFKYTFVAYLGGYGIWRFLIEFLRGDNRGEFVGNISPSQFWALLMIILAVPTYFFLKYLFTNRAKELEDIKEEVLEETI